MSKSTGNIFFNDFRKDNLKAPKYTGTLEITPDQIRILVADGKKGNEVKLKIGAFEYQSKKDASQVYYFLVAEAGNEFEKKKKGGWDDTDDAPF